MMRIACTSDAHGAKEQMDKLVAVMPEIDVFCFMGDVEQDALYLQRALAETRPQVPFYAVAGNNDPAPKLPGTLTLSFGETRALITHGHLFRARLSTMALRAEASRQGCALALFGHTHIPLSKISKGVHLVNPGALRSGRWALVDISEGAGSGMNVSLLVL